jgi:EpsI family protein
MLSALLVVTALLVHLQPGRSFEKNEKEPLRQVFDKIGGWRLSGNSPMDVSIAEELKLDDYLFQSYGRDKGLVTLYIGYYSSAKKVGAAHDPLVCFQGQGWQISNRETGEYLITRVPPLKISYSSMIAERQDERQLIVYWFQANMKASASTQSQKAVMVLDKLSGRSEDNAFVRISAPIGEEPPESVRKRLFDFIDDFYPVFYRYVTRT